MSEVNVLTRTERGDSLAKHLHAKHVYMHRGALWVSIKGTPYLCRFGNDNYERPRTKSYVEKIKISFAAAVVKMPSLGENALWGVDDETGTWVIATAHAKRKQSFLEPASDYVWSKWNEEFANKEGEK